MGILSREDYPWDLEADPLAQNMFTSRPWLFDGEIWKFQRLDQNGRVRLFGGEYAQA
jgi:hypothetical protein